MTEARFTVSQAAPRLGISKARLYELVKAREVPFRRLGSKGTIHFLQSDIDRILAESLVEPKAG